MTNKHLRPKQKSMERTEVLIINHGRKFQAFQDLRVEVQGRVHSPMQVEGYRIQRGLVFRAKGSKCRVWILT